MQNARLSEPLRAAEDDWGACIVLIRSNFMI